MLGKTLIGKTSELRGKALDWAVAKCEEIRLGVSYLMRRAKAGLDSPSTDWAQGGSIIEREAISVTKAADQTYWWAGSWDGRHTAQGPTPLIAAMRCYVASKLGDEVDLPEGL